MEKSDLNKRIMNFVFLIKIMIFFCSVDFVDEVHYRRDKLVVNVLRNLKVYCGFYVTTSEKVNCYL